MKRFSFLATLALLLLWFTDSQATLNILRSSTRTPSNIVTAFTAVSSDYAAHINDCQFIDFSTFSDTAADDGTGVKKDQVPFNVGAIACKAASVTSGTYTLEVRQRTGGTRRPLWVSTSPLSFSPDNGTTGSWLNPASTWTWQVIGSADTNANFGGQLNGTGSRTFTLNGDTVFYIMAEHPIDLDCLFLRVAGSTAAPLCASGGAGGGTFDYEVLNLGVNAAPTESSDHWLHATAIPFTGYDSSGGELTTTVGRCLWKSTATKKLYCRFEVPDTEVLLTSLSDEDIALIDSAMDKIDIRWRGDSNQVCDLNVLGVVANLQNPPAKIDFDRTSCGENAARVLNVAATRTIPGANYRVFVSADLGHDIAAGSVVIGQFSVVDTDTGLPTKLKIAFGNSAAGVTDMAQWGRLKFSSTAIPDLGGSPPPDTTAPSVTACSAISVTSSSFSVRCTVTDAVSTTFSAKVRYGTATKTYTSQTSVSSGVTSPVTIAVTGLSPSTTYFWVMDAVDAANNTGTSSEGSQATSAAPSGTHFVGPTAQGSANCSSDANRCLLGNVWSTSTGAYANVTAGSTIIMASGTYTGASGTINPPGGLNGTQTNPITVKAATDGGVTIDGQFQRRAVDIVDNDWFILEGFNAHSGGDSVVVVRSSSTNNILRRFIAWNVSNSNSTASATVSIGGPNNLMEDCAAFGTGRKVLYGGQTGNDNIFRRCWVRFQEHPQAQIANHPDTGVELGYNALRQTFENIISTWNETGGGAYDEPEAVMRMWGTNGQTLTLNSYSLGNISYMLPGYVAAVGTLFSVDHASQLTFKDSIAYAAGTSKTAFFVETSSSNNLTIQNVYGVSNNTGGFSGSGYTKSTTLAGAIGGGNNVFTTVNLCFRYQDRVLTSTKLWPWPMDQRIKDAITLSGYPSVTAGMANNTGFVTDAMEQLFGQTIPTACKN